MSAGFTPGPWRACAFSSIVGSPVTAQPDKTKNTFNICSAAAPVSREENEANARLIATAPELYEALEKLFASYKRLADSGDAGNWSVEDLDEGKEALAALAKARGEQS